MRFFFILFCFALGCKSQLNSSATEVKKDQEPDELVIETKVSQPPRYDEIPPGHARIIAVVSEIYPADNTGGFPCSEQPCRALITVEQVLGYGHSFGGPIPEGQQLEVYFPLSLKPSKEIFPDREVADLSGLNQGDRFEAHLKSTISLGNKNNYRVSSYQRK